jgi:flavin reductase (DIM6/NTAB) family NADH-FMN oxidoreductase RutF
MNKKQQFTGVEGVKTFPAFPVVLVTVRNNIITVAALDFFSFKPPIMGVGICPVRYSYKLIKEDKEFGINIPTKNMLDAVEFCGLNSGRDVDKFKATGLTPMESKIIRSKLIEECPVNLECKVIKELLFCEEFEGTHDWFIGKVEMAHIDDKYDRTQALMYWWKKYRTVGEPCYTSKI